MSPLGRLRRGGDEPRPPAPFVVGVGRSGTTLLRLMLDAHPQLAVPPETHFVPELIARDRTASGVDELVDEIIAARNWDDFGLDGDELRTRARGLERPRADAVLRCFYDLYAEREGKSRWGDKTPIYVKRMRMIGDVLAEARFVHLIRDGRDVALSRRRRGMGTDKPLGDIARRWTRRIVRAREQGERLRERYLELRYEDLVADPDPALRRVCELCALEFDPAMLDYHRRSAARLGEMARDLPAAQGRRARTGEERMAAHALATQPPSTERIGGWRQEMSAEELREFEREAGDLLAELGYDLAS